MLNFKNLIKKFSKHPAYLLRQSEGYYDYEKGGVWVDGIEEELLLENSAIIPLSNSDLKYDEGGTYTVEDRKLYTYTDMATGEKVKHKDKIYKVQERKDYSDFDYNLFIYFIKRIETQ